MSDALDQQHCEACNGATPVLDETAAHALHGQLHSDWTLDTSTGRIQRRFAFRDYYQSMAFANAVAWIANTENHHPDMHLSYRHCSVIFTTHAIAGLSRNDFICAAKIDALLP